MKDAYQAKSATLDGRCENSTYTPRKIQQYHILPDGTVTLTRPTVYDVDKRYTQR